MRKADQPSFFDDFNDKSAAEKRRLIKNLCRGLNLYSLNPDYERDKEGALLSIPPKSGKAAQFHLIMLHGNGSNAEDMLPAITDFQNRFPDACLHAVNGYNTLDGSEFKDVPPSFRMGEHFNWAVEDASTRIHDLALRLREDKNAPDLPIILFGFSAGGFLAAQSLIEKPDLIDYAFLHSSGLVVDLKKAQKPTRKIKGKRAETLMSVEDPFLRQAWALAILPVHYWRSFRMRLKGLPHQTHITRGFAHNINEKSLSIFEKRLRKHFRQNPL